MEYKFRSVLEKFQDSKVWGYHFKVTDTIINKLSKQGKRFICTLNDTVTYHCALLSAGDKGYFINVNATIRKKAKLSLYDEVSILLRVDNSKYGILVPEVFAELLKQDPEFNQYFHVLTVGKQRTLLHLVGSYRLERTQIEKLMIVRDYLVFMKGRLDFKELQQAFRNNRYK